MKILSELLPGVLLLEPHVFTDHRGIFVKTYHKPDYVNLGINFDVLEEYYSTSHKGVIRGMHLQLPPYNYDKLVYCTRGSVLDVVLDLRKNSPTYGKASSVELSNKNHLLLLIPNSVAHGFLALENDSVMAYKTSSIYVPSHDTGVRWDSFGFDWPLCGHQPIISQRDTALPLLAEFQSPF